MELLDLGMRIPTGLNDFHKAHPLFNEATRDQAFPRHGSQRTVLLDPVRFPDRLWFLGDVEGFRGGNLHSTCDFPCLDAGFQSAQPRVGFEILGVECRHHIALGREEVFRPLGFEKTDGFGTRSQPDALKLAGKKIGSESDVPAVGQIAGECDKTGEVFALGAERVVAPGADAGALLVKRTGVHAHDCLEMVRVAGVQRVDEAELVGLCAEMGEQAAEHHSRLSARVKVPDGAFEKDPSIAAQGLSHAGEHVVGNIFRVVPEKGGLVVKAVDVREAAVEKDENDAFGLGGMRVERGLARGNRGRL